MPSENLPVEIEIYTDGAAEPNPGPGGYGVVLMSGKHRKELTCGYRLTTNNRMELLAVIAGLEKVKHPPQKVSIYSDSKYVVDAINKRWVLSWEKNNWKRKKANVKNIDLWKRFLSIYRKHKVELRWIPGHAGIPENEKCDQLAVNAAQSDNLLIDEGYENSLKNSDLHTPKQPEKLPETNKLAAQTHEKIATATNNGTKKLCRHCGEPLVQKTPERKRLKPRQTYYFEWYLYCTKCKRMYMVEEAKRYISENLPREIYVHSGGT